MKSPKNVENHIINWLTSYLESSGLNGFVVGVSGGIDSAVTSTLCAKTNKEVLVLEMPIKQGASQVTRAQEHIQWLTSQFKNVRSHRLSLDNVFNSFKDSIPPTEDTDAQFLSLANTRARLRMTSLYYFAALHKYLVAGTGNKVEDFGVGFYTKYGDGGVDLSPIADLMKTEVYSLAKHQNIVESIQNAAPTDGLWGDDRTDEDQLGASYPDLEWAMDAQETQQNPENFNDQQKKVYSIYLKHHNQNLHKMEPIPVCEIPKGFI
jgi:NAD+ synthase